MTYRKTIISLVLLCSLTISMTAGLGPVYAGESSYDEVIIETVEIETLEYEYDAIERFASRMYLDVLNRTYDRSGLLFWADHIRSSRITGADFAHSFFFSTEFALLRVGDAEFINRMYIGLMGRIPDPGGREYWLGFIQAGLPREDIFHHFVNSPEFSMLCVQAGITRGYYTPPPGGMARIFAKRLLTTTMEREPSATEINNLHEQFIGGMTGASAVYQYIFGAEVINRRLNDEQFVELLFETILWRPSDAISKADYVNRLREGTLRHSIFASFIDLPEFANICLNHGITKGTVPQGPVDPNQLKGKIIFLDPGHGTVGSPGVAGYNEAIAMLGLARRIRPMLEARGATVIMTRENEINILVSQRCAIINKHALEDVRGTYTNVADIEEIDRLIEVMDSIITDPNLNGPLYMNLDPFNANKPIHPDLQRTFEITNNPVIKDNYLVISLHSNAVAIGGSSAVRGAEVYYISPNEVANTRHYSPDFSFSLQSRNFANILLDHIQNAGIPRRINGLRPANYAMIREINVPAVLSENGFHTNPEDRTLLLNPGFMDRLAVEYTNAIVRYFG